MMMTVSDVTYVFFYAIPRRVEQGTNKRHRKEKSGMIAG